MRVKSLGFATLLVAAVLLVGGSLPNEGVETSPAWAVSGIWTEACDCNPPCPCWNRKLPTFDHCENIQAFQIAKGQYGNVQLDGVIVVIAWVPPGGELMRKSIGRSKLFAIYLDTSTTQPQRDAVDRIWRSEYFSGVKAALGDLRAVTINADLRSDYARISIPGVLAFEAKELKGYTPTLKRENLTDFRQGISIMYRYSDFGMKCEYPGKHAMFANFQALSPVSAGSK